MKDIKLPQFLGQIGNVYRLIYSPKKDDKNIKLSTSLKKAYEPIVVYSSGVNNLMREVGSNPFAIKGEYKARDKKPNYYYTLEKAKDPKTLNTVIDGIEKNYDNILNINPKADIYSLGAYIPKSLEIEGMNIFRELIVAYNEKLSELCKQYNITYINTENVGKTYNSSENNFHVSTSGHYALANYILEYIYKNKVNNNNVNNVNNVNKNIIELTNKGSEGIIDSVLDDYEKSYKKSQGLTGYAQSRELDIALEHINEAKVFRKVYQNKSN